MLNKFNNLPNEVKKSIVDQLKLLAWATGGINVYFRHAFGEYTGIFFVIFGWVSLQLIAHYILFYTKIEERGAGK